jgi:hypothetical protein
MPLLFKHCALTSDQASWAQQSVNDGAPYVVLLNGFLEYDWIEEHFPKYSVPGEDCMGQTYIKETHSYRTFGCPAGRLYFFPTHVEYNKVIELLPEMVIDKSPFETII